MLSKLPEKISSVSTRAGAGRFPMPRIVTWGEVMIGANSPEPVRPFNSICCMPGEKWPEGSNATAVTEPISAIRRVSDLAELMNKRANSAGMAGGLRSAEIAPSMSRRA